MTFNFLSHDRRLEVELQDHCSNFFFNDEVIDFMVAMRNLYAADRDGGKTEFHNGFQQDASLPFSDHAGSYKTLNMWRSNNHFD